MILSFTVPNLQHRKGTPTPTPTPSNSNSNSTMIRTQPRTTTTHCYARQCVGLETDVCTTQLRPTTAALDASQEHPFSEQDALISVRVQWPLPQSTHRYLAHKEPFLQRLSKGGPRRVDILKGASWKGQGGSDSRDIQEGHGASHRSALIPSDDTVEHVHRRLSLANACSLTCGQFASLHPGLFTCPLHVPIIIHLVTLSFVVFISISCCLCAFSPFP